MTDEMRKIIDSIVPPTPMFGEDEDDDEAATPDHPPSVAGRHEAPSPPVQTLLPRQEAFCRSYITQPVATRAAVLAGYAERSAYNQGHRLLQEAAILARIAELRAERNLRYVIERDTSLDKLECVFLNAFRDRAFMPALAALRLQAQLAGLLPRPRDGHKRPKSDEKKRARRRRMMRKGEQ